MLDFKCCEDFPATPKQSDYKRNFEFFKTAIKTNDRDLELHCRAVRIAPYHGIQHLSY